MKTKSKSKNDVKLSDYKQKKYPDGIIVPKTMQKAITRLKNELKKNVNGTDSSPSTLNYEIFVLFAFWNMHFIKRLGINSLLRLNVFYSVVYLMLDDPDRCYAYSIVGLTGIHLRSVQLCLEWLEKKGLCVSRYGGRNNTKYYSLTLYCVELLVGHIETVRGATLGGDGARDL